MTPVDMISSFPDAFMFQSPYFVPATDANTRGTAKSFVGLSDEYETFLHYRCIGYGRVLRGNCYEANTDCFGICSGWSGRLLWRLVPTTDLRAAHPYKCGGWRQRRLGKLPEGAHPKQIFQKNQCHGRSAGKALRTI